MKIRPLPITDLARIATLPLEMQRPALEQVKEGGGQGSYRPTREKLPDIVNRQPGMFESERAPWAVIESDIKKLSRSDVEEGMNLLSAKSIYQYCEWEKVRARELDGFPLTMSIGLKLICWSPALFLYPDRETVPFFDMRRAYRLTYDATTFMFSAMHLALRVNNPDYSAVEFEILRLRNNKTRSIVIIREKGRSLFSYEELERMVATTYGIWNEILAGRRDDRRRGSGDDGGLFGER